MIAATGFLLALVAHVAASLSNITADRDALLAGDVRYLHTKLSFSSDMNGAMFDLDYLKASGAEIETKALATLRPDSRVKQLLSVAKVKNLSDRFFVVFASQEDTIVWMLDRVKLMEVSLRGCVQPQVVWPKEIEKESPLRVYCFAGLDLVFFELNQTMQPSKPLESNKTGFVVDAAVSQRVELRAVNDGPFYVLYLQPLQTAREEAIDNRQLYFINVTNWKSPNSSVLVAYAGASDAGLLEEAPSIAWGGLSASSYSSTPRIDFFFGSKAKTGKAAAHHCSFYPDASLSIVMQCRKIFELSAAGSNSVETLRVKIEGESRSVSACAHFGEFSQATASTSFVARCFKYMSLYDSKNRTLNLTELIEDKTREQPLYGQPVNLQLQSLGYGIVHRSSSGLVEYYIVMQDTGRGLKDQLVYTKNRLLASQGVVSSWSADNLISIYQPYEVSHVIKVNTSVVRSKNLSIPFNYITATGPWQYSFSTASPTTPTRSSRSTAT